MIDLAETSCTPNVTQADFFQLGAFSHWPTILQTWPPPAPTHTLISWWSRCVIPSGSSLFILLPDLALPPPRPVNLFFDSSQKRFCSGIIPGRPSANGESSSFWTTSTCLPSSSTSCCTSGGRATAVPVRDGTTLLNLLVRYGAMKTSERSPIPAYGSTSFRADILVYTYIFLICIVYS